MKKFSSIDVEFIKVAKSLHALLEHEKELAKEFKIQTVNVGRGDNYPSWAKKSRLSNSPLQQLKLLNGDYPTGELEVGQLAKKVR